MSAPVALLSDRCMCGHNFRNPQDPNEFCPRCWPDRQPKETQLSLFEPKEPR